MCDDKKDSSCKKQFGPLLNIEDVLPIINDISIFAGLSDKQLYALFRLLKKGSYKTGEKVFEEGTQPNHIYVVQSGSVKLVVNAEQTPLELIVFKKGIALVRLGLQTRVASGVTAPLAAEAVFALVLAALLIGLRLVHQARNSSESAISHIVLPI